MKFKADIKSPIDGIIIDLIMDHFNMQSMSGLKENLTGEEFNTICAQAEEIYYDNILIGTEPGVA
jgi:hypothetical protein